MMDEILKYSEELRDGTKRLHIEIKLEYLVAAIGVIALVIFTLKK